MKNLVLMGILGLGLLLSCQNNKDVYHVDISDISVDSKIINVADDIYNPAIPFDTLKNRYYFIYNPETPDSVYIRQRTDSLELVVYKNIKQKIDEKKLDEELDTLFRHIKYYYPKFEAPIVYVYSSNFDDQMKYNPVIYNKEVNVLVIYLDYFLGKDSKFYQAFKVENYLRENMNPENIVPMASMAIGETIPLMDIENNQFLNYLITYGKVMLLQDAFLPGYPDYLKIGYTEAQIQWCYANERNMWDYFIQNDYLYSDDKDLLRRFLYPAPFSKFYISDENNQSVDLESPGGVGKWLGWQILRSYRKENPEVSIAEIMANRNFEQIFKDSKFQP